MTQELPEAVRNLMALSEKATQGVWEEGWNTRYFDNEINGQVSMCGRGPDTMVLRRDHPRFQELIAEPAFADAKLLAALVNWFRSNGPQALFEAGRDSMREEAAKEPSTGDILLAAGELSKDTLRAIKAVLAWHCRRIRSLP